MVVTPAPYAQQTTTVPQPDVQLASHALQEERTRRLRAQLRELRDSTEELHDLVQRGKRFVKWSQDAAGPGPDLDTLCNYAARLCTAGPPQLPITSEGLPAVPLPSGCSLPFPATGTMALATLRGCSRAPPPEAHVVVHERKEGAGPGAWEVKLRPLPPATVVMYTTNTSLPRPDNPAAKRASKPGGPGVLLGPGSGVIAVAFGPMLVPSDSVTYVAPKVLGSPLGSARVPAAPPDVARLALAASASGSAGANSVAAACVVATAQRTAREAWSGDQRQPAEGPRSPQLPSTLPQQDAARRPAHEQLARLHNTADAKAQARSQFRGRLLLGASDSEDDSDG